jgi:hypothetical protein
MTKTIKLSLAAAAVAGLTTSAFAAPTISGSLAHKFDKKDTAESYTMTTKTALKASGSVNDSVSYLISYAARANAADSLGAASVNLSNAKFTIKTSAATVIAGRQGLTTPWTTGGNVIDGTQTGNGVLALAPMGAVTLAGAYVVNHNIAVTGAVGTSSDIAIVAALGKAGPVNFEAWYANVGEDTAVNADGLTGMTVAGSGKFGPAAVKARYSSVTSDALAEDQDLLSVEAKMKFDSVTLNAGFATTSNGDLVSLDTAGAAAANNIYAGTWNISMGGGAAKDAATLISLGASAPLTSTLTANANYGQRTGDGVDDTTEIKGQISAKVAKNMKVYVRAAQVSPDAADSYLRTRLFASYKF